MAFSDGLLCFIIASQTTTEIHPFYLKDHKIMQIVNLHAVMIISDITLALVNKKKNSRKISLIFIYCVINT